jgi:glycosyltransferase involved in cell wall biosynthesis
VIEALAVDTRWDGNHGIGRVSREILSRLGAFSSISSSLVGPASALDPLWLAHRIRASRARLFFSPGYNAAAFTKTPQLLILHDLIHLEIPAESSVIKRQYYERVVLPAVRRTGRVVTVSEFSRERIVRWTALSHSAVAIARPGLSRAFEHLTDEPLAVPSRPYVLYVGNEKPHKNLRLLLAAMRHLPDLLLMCVGVTRGHVLAMAGSDLRADQLMVRNDISDRELAGVYRMAFCVALPSIYEGFGLPALESLSQATPVVYMADSVAEIVTEELGVRVQADVTPSEFAAAITSASALRAGRRFEELRLAQLAAFSWNGATDTIRAALNEM